MRVENAIRNIKVAMVYQIINLLLNFIDRKLFVQILGVEYLGVHGLFTNMMSMLALAELGVGTAIIYNLYEPLARGDEEQVTALMKIYRKLYRAIGALIGGLGVLTTICLPLFIKDVHIQINELRIAYLVFVVGTMMTYWTGYKRSLLYADQKNYVLLLGDMGANLLGMLTKIGILMIYPSYSIYIFIHTLSKIIPNVYASVKVNKLYPYLKKHKGIEVDGGLHRQVKKNVRDLFIHKISNFVVMSTDNLILSTFVGIRAVGLVANYQLIISAVTSFIAQGIEALQASVGHLITTEGKDKVHIFFERMNFICFWIASVTTVCLFGLIQPFIKLWLGRDYQISNTIIVVMLLNYILCVLTRPLWQLMSLSGFFKEDKCNALAEMSVNFILSLILVQKIGVVGVFIGTTVSYIVAWILKTKILYGYFFKKSSQSYYKSMIMYIGIILLEVAVTLKICKAIDIENMAIAFCIRVFICLVLPNSINLLLFRRSKHIRYLKEKVKERIKVMDRLKDANSLDQWLTKLFTILIFIVPLHGSLLPVGDWIGKGASFAFISMSGLYILWQGFSKDTNPKKVRYGIVSYLFLMFLLCMSGMLTGGLAGLKVGLWIGMVTCTGVACTLIDWNKLRRGILIVDIGIVIWIYQLYKGLMEWEKEWMSFSYIYANPNFLGIVILVFILILMLAYSQKRAERYLLYGILLVPILLETRARTSLMALIVAIGIYIIWYMSSRWKITHWLVWVGIIGTLAGITIIYPSLRQIEGIDAVSNLVGEISQKALFSGRERLWAETITFIKEEPVFGYGLQITLQELNNQEFNTHNQYLQILLQGGWIGLALVVGILSTLWYNLKQIGHYRIVRIGGSILIALLVVACFENTLLGESVTLGILQWSILGVGISQRVVYERAQKIQIKREANDEKYSA